MSTFSKNMFQGINMSKSWYQKRTDKKRIDCLMETKEHIKVDTPAPVDNATFDMDAAEIHEMLVAIEELEPMTPEPEPVTEETPVETVAEPVPVAEVEPEPVKVEEPTEAPAEEPVAKPAPKKKSKKKNS